MSSRFSVLLMLLIFMLGCASKDELQSEAMTDRESAEDWRKHRDPALGKYYSKMYKKNAAEKEVKADSMMFNDGLLSFVAEGISVMFGDGD